MEFSSCEYCHSWPGAFGLAMAWCLPALLWAVRRREVIRPAERWFLGAVQYAFVALATALTLKQFCLLDNPLFTSIATFLLIAACVWAAVFGMSYAVKR